MQGRERDADTVGGYMDMGRGGGMNWGIEIDICARAYLAQSCLIFATPWIVTHQNLLSIDFSRHKYCSGLLFLTSEDLLNQGIEAPSLVFLY